GCDRRRERRALGPYQRDRQRDRGAPRRRQRALVGGEPGVREFVRTPSGHRVRDRESVQPVPASDGRLDRAWEYEPPPDSGPAGLARPTQAVLGTLVLVVNLVAYGVLVRRK